MNDQQPLFEVINEDQYRREHIPRATKELATEPRTLTTWLALSSSVMQMGFCTVPAHDEVQKLLKPGQLEYRQMYPTRMVFELNGMMVCRDCFVTGADKE